MKKSKKRRVRNKNFVAKAALPRVTHEPWSGYTRHDGPREAALACCPSRRCRRAKLCIEAHDNLYCQRTHYSPAEQEMRQRSDPVQRELDSVPPVMDPTSLTERMERIADLASIRRAHTARMTKRWKAGEFDGLYGKYTAKGVVLQPPPKIYVEAARLSSTHTRVRALG
jgi:hypothetical protein